LSSPFLDTLKVRTQVAEGSQRITDSVQRILKTDGILSLWRGATVAFLGQICENTTSFVLNAYFHRLMGESEFTISKSFAVGSVAGVFTALIICPMETIKCKVQVAQIEAGSKHGVQSAIKEILKSQGIKGFYYGLIPQMARDIPGSAIYFGCYDTLDYIFRAMNLGTTQSCLLAGGFAGQIYWFSALPMDRVKSIIQTQRYDCIPGSHAAFEMKSSSPLEGFRAAVKVSKILYNLHGVRGFYQGGIFAVVRAFPTNASLFYGYKSARKFLDEITGTESAEML
jgi:uncharacterized membrane protein YciS (DUF1049 family)